MKREYIQPQTDFVRMTNGQPICLEQPADVLVGSCGKAVDGTWSNAPGRHIGHLIYS